MCISNSGKFLFTTGVDFEIKQWDLATKTLHSKWPQLHKTPVYQMVISKNDKFLFTAGKNGYLIKRNIETRKVTKDYGEIH
jgi:WD40 repeat protein